MPGVGPASPRPTRWAYDRPMTISDDVRSATEFAESAGRVLLRVRREYAASGPADLKSLGDRSSHEHLMSLIATRFPADAVLSEEGSDDRRRLSADRVWIVDPLDGTREFSELDRDDWAVHVALWDSGRLTAGAVALPARGVSYTSAPGSRRSDPIGDPLRLAVSRTRPPDFVQCLAADLGAELVPMGSAGVKAMSVLAGTTDAYVHAGGQYEWDSAAPVAVAAAHGLHVSRIDGTPLEYNRPDPWLPDLVVCRQEAAERILAALAASFAG